MNKCGIIDEHKTFKGFTKVSYNLNRKEYFIIADGSKTNSKNSVKLEKII